MTAQRMNETSDVVLVGGGIVGLATAHQLLSTFPHLRLLLLEKEAQPAAHQTGHNSGVIHSGIYYKPGSAKARTCVAGAQRMKEFCQRYGLAHDVCGKIVVATSPEELPRLDELHRRGTANGVPDLAMLEPEAFREIEPNVTGLRALHVPGSGIVDYVQVASKLKELVEEAGGDVRMGVRVDDIRSGDNGVEVETTSGPVRARYLVNCAGLHSDRVTKLEGGELDAQIVPFRGEYYEFKRDRSHLVKHLIYPVPDPQFPFLGVHFTRMIHGGVEAGPNAVLAFAREGYTKGKISARDLAQVFTYGGFWRLALKHWRMGLGEMYRSFSKRAFVTALQKLVPDVQEDDLVPGGAGVRAQALAPTGKMVDDFLIVERPRALHVCNAPSPAATASLCIGEEIARRVGDSFDLEPAVAVPVPNGG